MWLQEPVSFSLERFDQPLQPKLCSGVGVKINCLETTELFRRIKNNELAAFNAVYKLYSRRILHFAYSFSICQQDAEEIVQDTFVKLWKKRDLLDLSRSADALLFVITKNLILNKIKQYAVERNRFNQYTLGKDSETSSLEELLNVQEMEAILEQIIEALPDKRKEIFKLNRMRGLTYIEIAESLSISPGTVEKQMKKALETVHIKFKDYYKFIVILVSSSLMQ